MDDDIYTDAILDELDSPYHRGHLQNPTAVHEGDGRPNCSDEVRLELLLDEDNRIKEAWFNGKGCAISQAAASILTREIEGRTLTDLSDLSARQMLELLHIPLIPARQKCALLSFKVLKALIYMHDRKALVDGTAKQDCEDSN